MEAQMESAQPAVAFRSFLTRVFSWMILGLAITGAIAFWLQDSMKERMLAGDIPMAWIWGAIIAQVGAVLVLSFAINKIPASLATVLFLGYAALTGFTFSFLFAFYSDAAIYGAFFATSAMFAALAGIGYFTKADLTRFGPLLFAALIGVVVGGLIGMIFSMELYNIVFIWIGLLVFMGLTVYDVNRMKRANMSGQGAEMVRKATIIGALQLYLDFINIFIRLLSIMGNR